MVIAQPEAKQVKMDERPPASHSFVIKVWIEDDEARAAPTWSGHITHVLSGERRYFRNLCDAAAMVRSYLTQMGVRLNDSRPPLE